MVKNFALSAFAVVALAQDCFAFVGTPMKPLAASRSVLSSKVLFSPFFRLGSFVIVFVHRSRDF
jgi:hypothetical protein